MKDSDIVPIDALPYYGISRDGRAWTCMPMGVKDGRPPTDWRELKGKPAGQYKYLAIGPMVNKRKTYRYIHELVLTTFKGPRPSSVHEARHLDGNNRNNHADNLEWGTPAENSLDKIRHGTSGAGEENANAKLTNEQAKEIKSRVKAGFDPLFIADDFGIRVADVHRIGNGRRWKNV